MFALVAGAGCSHGHTDANNGIYAVRQQPGAQIGHHRRAAVVVSDTPRTGEVELVSDLFATLGDHTPTVLAEDRDSLYVGTLGQIAFVPGLFPPVPDLAGSFEGAVYRLSPKGMARRVVDGLHAVLGIAFDRHHRMYVLQSPIFVPGTGSLVRVEPDGQLQTVAAHLVFPSGLTRGPDGAMYISECGYHCAPGEGRVPRVAVDR